MKEEKIRGGKKSNRKKNESEGMKNLKANKTLTEGTQKARNNQKDGREADRREDKTFFKEKKMTQIQSLISHLG